MRWLDEGAGLSSGCQANSSSFETRARRQLLVGKGIRVTEQRMAMLRELATMPRWWEFLRRTLRTTAPRANVGARSALARDSAPMVNSPTRRGTVDRPVTVPETEGRLLTASRLLSPHGTEMRARTPSHVLSTRSSSRARRSRRDRHPGARDARERANPREIRGEKATAPEIALGGRCLLTPLAMLARRKKWLRIRRRLLPRSRGSRRDGFAPLAPSRKCERLRIQVVGRREPGRSLVHSVPRRTRAPFEAGRLQLE